MILAFMATTLGAASVERVLRKLAHWNVSAVTPEEALRRLDEPFQSLLDSMYRSEPQVGSDGQRHQLDALTRIAPVEGMWLHDLCRKAKPEKTLEIGLAYGFSTLFFLAAIKANGRGEHVAIDPCQADRWDGIGAQCGRNVGMDHAFHFVPETSVQALTRFARDGRMFDIIFVDGAHFFDAAIVDFFLAADVCSPGGYIILDDLWLPAIRKVVAFVRSNRLDFTEVETPLHRLWARWSTRAPARVIREIALANVAVFQKTGDDKRVWSHFVDFR
jgi:predicted O-methyltransferase YrrM